MKTIARFFLMFALTTGSVFAEQIAKVYTAGNGGFSCVLSDRGRVKCWGNNDYGQCGQGVATRTIYPSPDLKPIDLDEAHHGPVLQLALGSDHACALFKDNQVFCWGSNFGRQLGQPQEIATIGQTATDLGARLKPVDFGRKTSPIVQLAAGNSHTCAVFLNGRMKCWGDASNGQTGIGSGDSAQKLVPLLPEVNLGKGVRVKLTAAQGDNTCAVTTEDGVKCWGVSESQNDTSVSDNALGFPVRSSIGIARAQMGDSLPYVALPLQSGEKIKAITLGSYHACVLARGPKTPAGRVLCWGNNAFGQLGVGDERPRGSPKTIAALKGVNLGLDPDDAVVDVQAGPVHSCAFLKSGRAKCWGDNRDGVHATGDTVAHGKAPGEMGKKLAYVNVAPGMKLKSFSSKGSHACGVVDLLNAVKCWGSNDFRQAGVPDVESVGIKPEELGNNLPYLDVGF